MTKSIDVIFNETAKSQSSSRNFENSIVNTNISHSKPSTSTTTTKTPHTIEILSKQLNETVNVPMVSNTVTNNDGNVIVDKTVMPSTLLPMLPVNQMNRMKKNLVNQHDIENNANDKHFRGKEINKKSYRKNQAKLQNINDIENILNVETNQNENIPNDNFELVTELFDDSGSGEFIDATSSYLAAFNQINDNHYNQNAVKCDDCLQNDSPSIIMSKFQTILSEHFNDNEKMIKTTKENSHIKNEQIEFNEKHQYRIDADVDDNEKIQLNREIIDNNNVPVSIDNNRNTIDTNVMTMNEDNLKNMTHLHSLLSNYNNSNDINAFVKDSQPQFRMVDNLTNATDDGNTQDAYTTQRILVNVSIATDSGTGTKHHGVYTIHVTVPIESMKMVDNPSVITSNNNGHTAAPIQMIKIPTHSNQPNECDNEQLDKEKPPQIPPRPPILSCNNENDDIDYIQKKKFIDDSIESSSILQNDGNLVIINESIISTMKIDTSTSSSPINSNTNIGNNSMMNTNAENCLNSYEIPPILILEGETIICSAHMYYIFQYS